MRIISKFKDYYDSALAHGHDDSVVFERTTHEVTFAYKHGDVVVEAAPDNADNEKLLALFNTVADKLGSTEVWYTYRNAFSDFSAEYENKKRHKYHLLRVYIIFCGKVYTPVRVTKTIDLKSEVAYCYDADSLIAMLEDGKIELDNKPKVYRWSRGKKEKTRRESLKTWFDPIEMDIDFLIANKVTIAAIIPARRADTTMIINPCLADLEFYKALDAYTAYQELDMWISGTLAWPPNFMIEVPEKYRLENHGFDPKYGFRTRPKN